MINKKLVHFNSKSTFEEKKPEISETSIVFVKDTNMIYTHEEEYQFVGWSYIGTVGEQPPMAIPTGYVFVKPIEDDWWIDSEEKIILVKE